jgi:glycosyltransferase involved in cell wall biosynthesis
VGGAAATYCDPDQPESIAAAIGMLLSDQSVYNHKRAEGLRQVQQFTWAATAALTLTIYQQVLER